MENHSLVKTTLLSWYFLILLPLSNHIPLVQGNCHIETASSHNASKCDESASGLQLVSNPLFLVSKHRPLYRIKAPVKFEVPQLLRVSVPNIPGRIRLSQGPNPGDELRFSGGLWKYPIEAFANAWNVSMVPVHATGGGTGLKNATTGKWSGVIGDVVYGLAEVGIVTGITFQRQQAVDFSYPFEFQEMSFVIRKPERIYTWKTIFWPFQAAFWVLVLTSSIFIVLVLAYMPLSMVSGTYQRFGMANSSTLTGKMLLEQTAIVPENGYFRIICVLWLLLVLNISTMYKSRFFTLLTVPVTEAVPTTFEELAVSGFATGLHFLGGAASYLIRTSRNPALVAIVERGLTNVPGKVRCYDNAMRERKFACIGWMGTIAPAIASNFSDKYGNSPLQVAKTPAFVTSIAFSVQQQSALRLPFHDFALRCNEAGLVDYWTKLDLDVLRGEAVKWRQGEKSGGDQIEIVENRVRPLSMKQLKGAFALWLPGVMVAVGTQVVETLLTLRLKRMNQDQTQQSRLLFFNS